MPAGGEKFADIKINFSIDRVRYLNPDILCFDEVSSSITDANAQTWANKYLLGVGVGGLGYVFCAVVINPGAHLNTVVFRKKNAKVTVTGDVIPADEWDTDRTRRNLVRIQYTHPNTSRLVGIWFLHANASMFGGKTAVDLVSQYVIAHNNDVVVGDFNNATPIAPKNLTIAYPIIGELKYSQWKVTSYAIDGAQIGVSKYAKPGGILDYALLNSNRTLVATPIDSLEGLSNDLNDGNSVPFLQKTFDHFPIVYDFTCP